MKRNEVIQKLNDMKDVLMQRGWAKSRLEDPEGKVCILGARNIAVYGSTLQDVDDVEAGGGYQVDEVSIALAEAVPEDFRAEFPHDSDDSINHVYRYNDHGVKDFNDLLGLIDTAIINEKEKGV